MASTLPPDHYCVPRRNPDRHSFLVLFLTLPLVLYSPLAEALLPPRGISASANQAPPSPVSSLTGPSLHYEFNGLLIPEDAFPLSLVFVGDPVDALTLQEMEETIQASIETWNQVPCSYARLQWAGFRQPDSLLSGEVSISFQTGTGDFADQIAWTIIPPTLTPDGLAIVLNSPRFRWDTSAHPFQSFDSADWPIIDLEAVLTHEIGHVLGLAHTTEHNAATMAARYLRDGSQRTLSADDKLGLCDRYPTSGRECAQDQDCPDGPCLSIDADRALCDIYLGAPGEYCGYELQHCPGLCYILEEPIGLGYCSTTCHPDQDDQDCPEYFSCAAPGLDQSPICLLDPPHPGSAPPSGCHTTGDGAFLLRDSSLLLFWLLLLPLFFLLRLYRSITPTAGLET